MKKIEGQQVQPRWGKDSFLARVGNPEAFNTVAELAEWCGGDSEREDFAMTMFAKQAFIKGGVRWFARAIEKKVPRVGDEKDEAYRARTSAKAREIAAGLPFPDMSDVLDLAWETRQKEGEERDPVVKLIREKWAASPEEKRTGALAAWGLAPEFVEAETEEVVAAYKATVANRKAVL